MGNPRPDVPCGIEDRSGGVSLPLGNVEPVADLPEPLVSCTVALECVQLWMGAGASHLGKLTSAKHLQEQTKNGNQPSMYIGQGTEFYLHLTRY